MAGEFAEKYPKVAGRLQLQPDTCEDPHVERLIEAFALLSGRVHRKLDDEFPEITEALLDVLYPHYLRPVPPQAIVQFQRDPSQSAPASTKVNSGLPIHSKPENGSVCSFRTCYPVTLWPLRVTGASVSAVNRFAMPGMPADAAAVIRIGMECLGGLRLEQLPLDSLRFYLNGESAAIHTLYEFLFLSTLRIAVRALPAAK
jgi:type VI secretion system protein ImpG